MKALVISLFVVCFALFWWGTARFFAKTQDGVPPGMKRISLLSQLFVIVQGVSYWFAPQAASSPSLELAALMYGVAIALWVAAVAVHWQRRPTLAYSKDEPNHLVRRGPYRWIRHPFYTAYVIAWLAPLPATGQLWHLAITLVMSVLYDRSARLEEQKFANSDLAGDYELYRDATGRYFPNPLKMLRGKQVANKLAGNA